MDSSAIGNAIVQVLGSDPALLALMPNGVYFDVPPHGATRYVLVSLVGTEDIPTFGGRAIESSLYRVLAIGVELPGGPVPDVRGAADRIDQLLEDVPLAVSGYTWSTTHREEHVREKNPDDSDPAAQWHHRGGHYRVDMTIGASTLSAGAGVRKLAVVGTPVPLPPGPAGNPIVLWEVAIPARTLATDGDVLDIRAFGVFTPGTPIPGGDWLRHVFVYFGNVGAETRITVVERNTSQPYDLGWRVAATLIRGGAAAQVADGNGAIHGGTAAVVYPNRLTVDLDLPTRAIVYGQNDAAFTDAGITLHGGLVLKL